MPSSAISWHFVLSKKATYTGVVFFECVIFTYIVILLVIRVLPHIESVIIDRAQNKNIYTESSTIDNIGDMIKTQKNWTCIFTGLI